MATEENKERVLTLEERLKAHEEKAAKKAEAEAQRALERKVEEYDVAEKFEKLGERGVKFEVISTDVGVFAVRCPDFTTAKKFSSIAPDKRTDEDLLAFVDPCVIYPENKMLYRAVTQEHAGVAGRLAIAMLAMYEGKAKERVGKF